MAISLSGGVDSMVIAMALSLLKDKYSGNSGGEKEAHIHSSDSSTGRAVRKGGAGSAKISAGRSDSDKLPSARANTNKRAGMRIGTVLAVHIDYANRDESAEEAAYVQVRE